MRISAAFFIFSLIEIFGTFITFKLMSLFNGEIKNKKATLVSFIALYFVTMLMALVIRTPRHMMIVSSACIMLLSFNFHSSLAVKIKACIYITFIGFMAETAIVLIAQQPTADTTTLSNDTLHLYFSNELVKYITAICIETIKQYKRFHITVYFKRYVPLFIALFLLFADMAFQIGGISFGNTLLALLTVFYILFLIAFLYVRHHKEQKSLIQERDNLAEAYKLLVDASHTLVSVHNNMNNHVTILNDLMKKNSLALSQAAGISADATALSGIHAEDASSPSVIVPSDTFQLLEQTHQNVIQYLNSITQDVALMEDRIDTGNQVIDSIVNIKIVQAKNQGITIKSEIFIPVGVKVDNYTMTIVLGTLFDAAIEELSQARNKNLHFFMKFDMGHVLVCLIHADELGPEKRKKNRFVYRDDFKLKEAKRAAEKHHGTLRVRVAEENVEAFAQICAHQGNTD